MRIFKGLAVLGLVAGVATLEAAFIPIQHLDAGSIALFQAYTAKFEQGVSSSFTSNGKMWIDDDHSSKHREFDQGKPVVEARENQDVGNNGSIHHFSGTIRVPNASIEQVQRIMEDYSNYANYFRPDVARGSGVLQPDSTPEDEHYLAHLVITETTLWLDVAFDSHYDSRYHRIDANRWTSRSTTVSIREMQDAHKLDGPLLPEGEDHGFLWRTNTYWFARERDGGLDLQLDSMTLSRTTPIGFNWWGNKRTHDAVDKMLRDTKSAIDSIR